MMLETDAPYMGFVKHRRGSEPADVVGIAQRYVRTCVVAVVVAAAVVVAVVVYTSVSGRKQ
jgi:Tat protein secretion system quality control protein TatD with DNase activity